MKTIMIVDDSTAIRNIIKNALVSEYEIREAENGEEALKLLPETAVDLFLLDVNMPVLDGIHLLKEIRQLKQHNCTPVIMLTTETKAERKQEAKSYGANGWMIKPFEPEQLLNVIKKMI